MGCRRTTRRTTRGRSGQAMTEFALIAPLVIFIIWSMIYGGFLFIQNEEVVSASRASARAGSIEAFSGTLFGVAKGGGVYCEKPPGAGAYDNRMAVAASRVAGQVPVNSNDLCTPGGTVTNAPGATITMSQPSIAGQAQISAVVVNTTPPPGKPVSVSTITVTVSYRMQGLAPPFNQTFNMVGQSEVPAQFP